MCLSLDDAVYCYRLWLETLFGCKTEAIGGFVMSSMACAVYQEVEIGREHSIHGRDVKCTFLLKT